MEIVISHQKDEKTADGRGVARGGYRGFWKPPLESVILIVTYHSDSAIRSH